MNDLISRSALLEVIAEAFFKTDPTGEEQHGYLACSRMVREFPAVDAVEVVRCRDCKHGMITKFGNEEPMITTCTHRNMFPLRIRPEFYCAYGAKMDAEVQDG